MIQFFGDTDILNRRVDNIATVRLATLQSQGGTTLQQSDLATPHTGRGALGKTHTSYMTTWRSVGIRRGNVAYCLAFSARTHHLYICTHMSWYRHVLRGTGCWDRGLSCEKAKGNVPVLRVHIIALRWYFLGTKVLCFFFSVTACHVLLIYARAYVQRSFVHTVLIPIVPYCIYVYLYIPLFTVLCPVFLPACHTTGFAWVPLYDYTKLHNCRLVQCITVSYWASVGPVPLVFYCASVFTHLFFSSLVPCPVPSVCMYSVLLHIWRPAYRSCIPLFGTHCPSVVFLPSDDSAVLLATA